MESKKSTSSRYPVVVGIAGGFAALAGLSIAFFNDADAAELSSAVAIFCSLIAVFLANDNGSKPCAKNKTL